MTNRERAKMIKIAEQKAKRRAKRANFKLSKEELEMEEYFSKH